MRWWVWAVLAWVLLSVPAALLFGRLIRTGQEEELCRACEHGRPAHEHYRAGSDCALCVCPQYVRPRRNRRRTWSPARAAWRGLPLPRRSSG